MKNPLCVLTTFCLLLGFGCGCPPERKEPERPSFVLGWDHFSPERPNSEAEFVLNEGESTDNGKIGIEVIRVLPPVDKCAEANSYSVYPRVEFRFYRPSDGKTLCQEMRIPGSILIGAEDCRSEVLGFGGLVISHINTKEKWVHLKLGLPLPSQR